MVMVQAENEWQSAYQKDWFEPGRWTLSYFVRRGEEGRGYATKAASAAIAWMRDNLAASVVVMNHNVDNPGSRKVVEKLVAKHGGKRVADSKDVKGTVEWNYRIEFQ